MSFKKTRFKKRETPLMSKEEWEKHIEEVMSAPRDTRFSDVERIMDDSLPCEYCAFLGTDPDIDDTPCPCCDPGTWRDCFAYAKDFEEVKASKLRRLLDIMQYDEETILNIVQDYVSSPVKREYTTWYIDPKGELTCACGRHIAHVDEFCPACGKKLGAYDATKTDFMLEHVSMTTEKKIYATITTNAEE